MNSQSHAYQLRYTWTAWPASGTTLPPLSPSEDQLALHAAWEGDGLRVLKHEQSPTNVRILFSCKPDVAPSFLVQRAKGRIQHVWRKTGHPATFSRKFSCVSVGGTRDSRIEKYLRNQFKENCFADSRYREHLRRLSLTDEAVCLTEPIVSRSGRYVYALHLVFVTRDRWRMPSETARKVHIAIREFSGETYGEVARFAIMPDHMHVALRGNPQRSSLDIADRIRDTTGNAVGTKAFWMPSGYLGTFGPYGMGATQQNGR